MTDSSLLARYSANFENIFEVTTAHQYPAPAVVKTLTKVVSMHQGYDPMDDIRVDQLKKLREHNLYYTDHF